MLWGAKEETNWKASTCLDSQKPCGFKTNHPEVSGASTGRSTPPGGAGARRQRRLPGDSPQLEWGEEAEKEQPGEGEGRES